MLSSNTKNTYLFSIDLEDIRLRLPNPEKYKERVPANTYAYLNWLQKHHSKCTFFVTGDVATLYPSLIKEIYTEGHEIACHTFDHIPLDKQTPQEFKIDLQKNIAALERAGASQIVGFRAPIYSLTEKTSWAFDVLTDLGFEYSSSVMPAKNPLYGWESFGYAPRKINDKLVEIPITVEKYGPLTVPVVGGVYFRVFPRFLIEHSSRKCIKQQRTLVGYMHPYDVDTEQERYMNPGINNSKIYNFLMYYNRKNVFKRLDNIINQGYRVCTFKEYIANGLI